MILSDKPKVKPMLSSFLREEEQGLLTMDTDFLQKLDLEDIHMKIATGTLDKETREEIDNKEILSMPTKLKKSLRFSK